MQRNRRIQPRKSMEIPILYTREYDNIYHEALTYDISPGGLCFEAGQKFFNGDCFLIKPMIRIPGYEQACQEIPWGAQVQWCTINNQAAPAAYKVGIRRIETSELPKESPLRFPDLECELCGTRALPNAIDIQWGATLCTDCFKECYQDAGKTLKGTLGRFMSGNVI